MTYREPAVVLEELVVRVCKHCMRLMSQHGTKDDLNYRDCVAQRWYDKVVEGEMEHRSTGRPEPTSIPGPGRLIES